jgi:tRNA(Ile)-lysidine synthase
LAETAARLGRAAKAIDHYASALLKAHFRVSDLGVVSGPATAFASAPEEVALRSLARILKAVGGADYTPRLDAVESLLEAVASVGTDGAFKRTLSGAVIEVAKSAFTVSREWGRDGLADVAAPPGSMVEWDGRFRVEVPPLEGELWIGALGRSDRRLKSGFAGRAAIVTAPGVYRDGALAAVPAGIQAVDEGGPLGVAPVKCLVGQRLGIASEGAE